MEQRRNYAVVKDVRIKLGKEECAGGMGLKKRPNCAAAKGA